MSKANFYTCYQNCQKLVLEMLQTSKMDGSLTINNRDLDEDGIADPLSLDKKDTGEYYLVTTTLSSLHKKCSFAVVPFMKTRSRISYQTPGKLQVRGETFNVHGQINEEWNILRIGMKLDGFPDWLIHIWANGLPDKIAPLQIIYGDEDDFAEFLKPLLKEGKITPARYEQIINTVTPGDMGEGGVSGFSTTDPMPILYIRKQGGLWDKFFPDDHLHQAERLTTAHELAHHMQFTLEAISGKSLNDVFHYSTNGCTEDIELDFPDYMREQFDKNIFPTQYVKKKYMFASERLTSVVIQEYQAEMYALSSEEIRETTENEYTGNITFLAEYGAFFDFQTLIMASHGNPDVLDTLRFFGGSILYSQKPFDFSVEMSR